MTTLPRLIVIADRFTVEERAAAVVRAVAGGGVRWVHLRDHLVSDEEFDEKAERVVGLLRAAASGVLISINARLGTAERLGCSFHATHFGVGPEEARRALPDGAVIGASTHHADELRLAAERGADYAFFSPVFATRSKPGRSGVGTAVLASACATSSVPVFALGGVLPERVESCLRAGAHGVAVLSGVVDAPDPVAAAGEFAEAIRAAGS